MAESFHTLGTFRQRARLADKTTGLVKDHGRRKIAQKTHAAIDEFEERLRATQEAMIASDDDLPMSAEAANQHSRRASELMTLGRSITSQNSTRIEDQFETCSDSSSVYMPTVSTLPRTGSEPLMRPGHAEEPDSRRAMRPPSPLGFYDYGGISAKPRSMLAQRGRPAGDPSRPKYRQTSCGFYFPGASMKRGPYGFSMLDPIHMPQRSWTESPSLPTRWTGDPGDARPAQPGKHQARTWSTGPTCPGIVRTSKAHELRAKRVFSVLDNRREEAHLERIRFEQGVYEGKWRDPLLDGGATVFEQDPEEKHEWLGKTEEDEDAAKRNASRILFGLERAMREGHGNLVALFRAVNRTTPSVLETEEFLEGIVRLGIVHPGELALSDVVRAMLVIDPNYDGRANFTVLSRALAATQSVQKQRTRAHEQLKKQNDHIESHTYHASLPVDVVKLDWRSRSLFDFERSFDKFRQQQRELLQQHNEITQHSEMSQ